MFFTLGFQFSAHFSLVYRFVEHLHIHSVNEFIIVTLNYFQLNFDKDHLLQLKYIS